jgi:hypothetical protein
MYLLQHISTYFLGNSVPQVPAVRKEDKILAEMDELKVLHGNKLPPYKYRLWAEMIVRFMRSFVQIHLL